MMRLFISLVFLFCAFVAGCKDEGKPVKGSVTAGAKPESNQGAVKSDFTAEDRIVTPRMPDTTSGLPSYRNSVGIDFVLIPAGAFAMGGEKSASHPDIDPKDYERYKKLFDETNKLIRKHHVTISKDFYMGRYEVTQAQWQAVMGSNPSYFKGAHLPVDSVSRLDALVFIEKLNALEGTDKYRLPTEAEWEYAAKAGNSDYLYVCGNDRSQLPLYAWFGEGNDGTTHPVGQKKPNAWGLYDVQGNVEEFVYDYKGYYPSEPSVDPVIASSPPYPRELCENHKDPKACADRLRQGRACTKVDSPESCFHGTRGGNFMSRLNYTYDGLLANRNFLLANTKARWFGFRLAKTK